MTDADLKRRLRELRHAVGQCLSRLDAMDVRLAELERALEAVKEKQGRVEGVLSRKDLL